jgi:CRAL/TRIO-like protein
MLCSSGERKAELFSLLILTNFFLSSILLFSALFFFLWSFLILTLHFIFLCGVVWCRFLRARKFDLHKAKAMLLSAEQWRKDENIDELARCVAFFPYRSPPLFLAVHIMRTSSFSRLDTCSRLG